ncbi:hypothetical protein IWZ00DRAFT_95952 [Phyllosticta capitalensis]
MLYTTARSTLVTTARPSASESRKKLPPHPLLHHGQMNQTNTRCVTSLLCLRHPGSQSAGVLALISLVRRRVGRRRHRAAAQAKLSLVTASLGTLTPIFFLPPPSTLRTAPATLDRPHDPRGPPFDFCPPTTTTQHLSTDFHQSHFDPTTTNHGPHHHDSPTIRRHGAAVTVASLSKSLPNRRYSRCRPRTPELSSKITHITPYPSNTLRPLLPAFLSTASKRPLFSPIL